MSEWQKKQRDEREIDLGRLAKALLRWSWLLVAAAILFGVTSYLYSANAIDPTYRATFTAYVLSWETAEEGLIIEYVNFDGLTSALSTTAYWQISFR